MKEEINPALWQELKKLGRELSPDELRQRGVRRVITIKASQVSLGIERAINRTILERTVGRNDPEELRNFTAAASAEFTSTLRGRDARVAHEHPDDLHVFEEHAGFGELIEQHRRELQSELEAVHADLTAHRGFVEQQESPESWPIDAERADELRLRVQARLLPIFERLPAGSPPLRSVVADLIELFVEERAVSLAEQRREADAATARLERRIAKLIGSLEQTETVLARWADTAQGRASGYREVQGIDADPEAARAANVERRREMLSEIFHANVDLRDRVEKERTPAAANGS